MYQLTRMCREKGAVKHDDRVDALALGVKYFQDVLAISAKQVEIEASRQRWNNMLTSFLEAPETATDTLVRGGTFDEVVSSESAVYTWI
jgi:hypothetical protein